MTPKQFVKPFINPTNVENQAKLILRGAGLALIKPKFFKVNANEIAKEQTDTTSRKGSKWGTPTFDTFIFNANDSNKLTYKASAEFGGGDVIISAPFIFETALITVNQTKNIVKTPISGLNGTVKEYMSEGDFVINLKGVIAGNVANQRPEINRLNALISYLKAPLSIPISCDFLNELIISNIVIESYSYSQREGTRNIIDVEINMLSDTAIELSSSGGSQPQF